MEENASLLEPATYAEVKEAVMSLDKDSAPGLDGFSNSFCQIMWEEIGHNIWRVVDNFFKTGKLVRSLNKTYLMLIPKKRRVRRIEDYRLIALLLINGDAGRNFTTARGVRQGDLMSPYLFILVMEMVARYLKGQIMKGAIRLPYSVRVIPDVHWLMFADDLLLFSVASVKSITNIKRVPSQLEERIGFIINNSKSSLFTFNVDTPLEQRLANIGGWQAVKLPLDYLGVPLFTGNLSANLCAGLIAKFEKKLVPCKTQLLSYAGRACLIAHNLSSMGNFWMQVFSLPNEVLKKLEQCMAGFLWADTEVNRHIHQIARHTLCKPKAEGGIGLRLLEEVNVSLLAMKSISGEEYGVIVDQLKLSVAKVRSLGEARLTLPSKALIASMSIQLANETDKLVSNATELKDLSSRSIWDAIRQKGSQEGWRKRIWNNHIPARASWTTYIASHMRLTTQDRLQRHGVHLANRCHLSKEAFQRLQLKEDERKGMSTWLRTGILCEGRLPSLSMDTNVLQIVTYKKGITTMVMGMWRLRDMESIEAIFTEAQSREDEAELQVLNSWLQSMARVNGSLGIISNNEGWKRRLRAMLEGRRPINQKWHHMRAANQRLRVLSHLPTLEAGEQMCQYGERDGRVDGG
ncbi:retrotransposable element ORF2 protein [Nymphaea thermarum]|nr:retrotransposable element ORF2 protein [Nymphaea thermarum]